MVDPPSLKLWRDKVEHFDKASVQVVESWNKLKSRERGTGGKNMNNELTIPIFRSVLEAAIGTTRGHNDGGEECGRAFVLGQAMIEEIAENLSNRWNDEYGDAEITNDQATEFFEEAYPETDETTRGCRES